MKWQSCWCQKRSCVLEKPNPFSQKRIFPEMLKSFWGASGDRRLKGSALTRAMAPAAHPRCSSMQKTHNGWKSIKKCKWGPQTVHTIHLKRNCRAEIWLVWIYLDTSSLWQQVLSTLWGAHVHQRFVACPILTQIGGTGEWYVTPTTNRSKIRLGSRTRQLQCSGSSGLMACRGYYFNSQSG